MYSTSSQQSAANSDTKVFRRGETTREQEEGAGRGRGERVLQLFVRWKLSVGRTMGEVDGMIAPLLVPIGNR